MTHIDPARIKMSAPAAGHVGYPQATTHTWGEFAGLTIEFGGYGDISAIDPSSGCRLTLLDGFDAAGEDGEDITFTQAVRNLMDAIDQTGWCQMGATAQESDAVPDPARPSGA